jgi:Ca2+-dependent lipid-binding protein
MAMILISNGRIFLSERKEGIRTRVMLLPGGGSDPVWNQAFYFEVDDEGGNVTIKIFDEDKHSADDIIGEAVYDLYNIPLYISRYFWPMSDGE